MFIAHLPAGYLLTRLLIGRGWHGAALPGVALAAGLAGALAPDLDLLYFYFVDHCQTHHHRYWSHWPVAWLAVTMAGAVFARWHNGAALLLLFGLGGFAHLLLDTLVGDIWWLAPLVDRPFALFTVPARWRPWWLNFVLHWSFAVELVLCAWALWKWRRGKEARAKEQEGGSGCGHR